MRRRDALAWTEGLRVRLDGREGQVQNGSLILKGGRKLQLSSLGLAALAHSVLDRVLGQHRSEFGVSAITPETVQWRNNELAASPHARMYEWAVGPTTPGSRHLQAVLFRKSAKGLSPVADASKPPREDGSMAPVTADTRDKLKDKTEFFLGVMRWYDAADGPRTQTSAPPPPGL